MKSAVENTTSLADLPQNNWKNAAGGRLENLDTRLKRVIEFIRRQLELQGSQQPAQALVLTQKDIPEGVFNYVLSTIWTWGKRILTGESEQNSPQDLNKFDLSPEILPPIQEVQQSLQEFIRQIAAFSPENFQNVQEAVIELQEKVKNVQGDITNNHSISLQARYTLNATWGLQNILVSITNATQEIIKFLSSSEEAQNTE